MLTVSGPLSVITSSTTRLRTPTIASSAPSVSTSATRLSSSVVGAVGLTGYRRVDLRRECDIDLGVSVVVLAVSRVKIGVVVLVSGG